MTYTLGNDPGPLNCGTCAGELVIDGVSMHTAAWCCLDPSPCWMNFSTRHGNLVIPGARGTRALSYRRGELAVSLPTLISGWYDVNGDVYDDPFSGLQVNVQELIAALDPPAAPVATHASTIYMPDGSTLSAGVQVLGLTFGDRVGPVVRATLDLVIPAGGFTPTGYS